APGFLRSEAVLEHFGVTEANWRDAIATDPFFAGSETPFYVGRAIAALAADPRVLVKTGRTLTSWELAEAYGLSDVDGARPHWDRFLAGTVDERWGRLVAEVRTTFGREGEDAAAVLEEDRAALELRVRLGGSEGQASPAPTEGRPVWLRRE